MSATPAPPLPPPPTMPSAPIYLPSPFAAAPARGGFTRALLTTLALSIFGFSLTLNVYLLVFSGVLGGGPISTSVVRDGTADNLIAVVPVRGGLNAASSADLNLLLGEIEKDAALKAVVLEVNTPGGEVTPSDEMYGRILRLKNKRKIPVVVSMGAMATSGGYYIACAADVIVAQRTTWTGNIGVLLPRLNFSKLAEQYGVQDLTVASSGSTFKDATSPLKPDTPANKAYFQHLADTALATFKQVVAGGRGFDAATVDRVADGRVYTGPDALALKLVDEIGYLDDALDLAAKKANLAPSAVHAVRYEKKVGLFDALGGGSAQSDVRLPTPGSAASVSIDRGVIEDVFASRPLYLWRGQ